MGEKEFCVENLLFVTEYCQMKNIMLRNESLKRAVFGKDLSYTLDLPNSAPTSPSLPTENADTGPIKESLRIMYSKYINPSACLEVNISSGIRKQLIAMLESLDTMESTELITIIVD